MHKLKSFDFLAGETIPVNKPYRWTSFDVVNKVRYAVKKHMGIPKLRIGHAGTLDPLATGLLILCSGKHTKQIESMQELEKEYSGIFQLGATTPSFDLETEIDQTYPFDHISLEDIQKAVCNLTGEIDQVPPVFSAIKIGGRRAFDFARNKEELELKSRKVTVRAFTISSYEPPDVGFSIVCSKGTYIRSIARDLGIMLNSGAYLKSLHRDRIGHFESISAFEVDDLLNSIMEIGKMPGEL
ncbi:MAG: tRNA pseudouridine(55) synthase TruB [Bacteroidales bacterium]|nr:tRNA pseudouridine(55) synthase TruB [Bacteroidales bacterium]